jgi:hypothetical protein
MPERLTARVVPARPITVAVAEQDGRSVAHGILVNLSEGGACLWTDGFLRVGMHLRLQISFAQPTEMHEATGLVVWGQLCRASSGETRKYGLEWRGTPLCSRERLRELASRPVVAPEDLPHGSDPSPASEGPMA